MLKFVIGLVIGLALAFGYVRWGVGAPGLVQVPQQLRGDIVASASEGDLYDLGKPLEARKRALEVLFQNRPQFAADVDSEFGYPFLHALYVRRVIHDARLMLGEWKAYDAVLAKPALRSALEKTYGTGDETAIKRAMLMEKLKKEPFLSQWIAQEEGPVTPETLLPTLKRLSAQPEEKEADTRK